MGRSKETFGKKEVRNKQLKKRKEKAKRKQEKKDQGKTSFDDMLAYVDENGQITSEPVEKDEKEEINAEEIEVSVPKGGVKADDTGGHGKVKNFDDSRGFGFISTMQQGDVFFHINDCIDDVQVGDKVQFETVKGQKGLKAIDIKKV